MREEAVIILMNTWKIRIADPNKDAVKLVEIYRYYLEKTAISFEYVTPSAEEFRSRMKHTLEKYPYLVLEKDGVIGGYAYASSFVGRKAYDYSVETTIYLDQSLRHQGFGKRLYNKLEEILKTMGIRNLNACIGIPEEGKTLSFLDDNSMNFHAHLGYHLVGRFHQCGYKFNTWLDMVWMEKKLQEHVENPDPVIPFPEIRLETDQNGYLL